MVRQTDRIGRTSINYQGLKMTVIEYRNNKETLIEFEEINGVKERKYCKYLDFDRGKVKCNYFPTVYGVGYIGDASTSINGKRETSYKIWQGMIYRCYNEETQHKNPTYKGCSVCDEWHNYSNFKKWFNENYYNVENEKVALDKDWIKKGNKVYSPDTCVFAPMTINNLLTKSNKRRGELPIGVSFDIRRNKYVTYNKRFDNPIDCFTYYKSKKEDNIKDIADKYKHIIPTRLYNAMYNYKVDIND